MRFGITAIAFAILTSQLGFPADSSAEDAWLGHERIPRNQPVLYSWEHQQFMSPPRFAPNPRIPSPAVSRPSPFQQVQYQGGPGYPVPTHRAPMMAPGMPVRIGQLASPQPPIQPPIPVPAQPIPTQPPVNPALPPTGGGTLDPGVQNALEAIQTPIPAPAPAPAPPNAMNFGNRFSFGATAGSRSPVPNMVGDNFGSVGSSPIQQRVSVGSASATLLSGTAGDVNASLGFDANPVSGLDAFSTGPGVIQNGQVTYQLLEPTLPNVLAGPNAACFDYVGGVATSDDTVNFGDPILGGPFDLALLYQCDAVSIQPAGAHVGRIKTAEDVSPVPHDRFFFNYSLFTDVPLTSSGISVDRFTFGFEKTFWEGTDSFEVRLPTAVTLNSSFELESPDISNVEFGDIYMAWKRLLYRSSNRFVSYGLAVSVPTANDVRVFVDNQLLAQIENESVRVMPFLGGLVSGETFFAQGFLQIDVDVSGDKVTGDPAFDTPANYREPTLLYVDLQLGAWLLRNECPSESDWVTGLAAIFEMHYNRRWKDLENVNPVNIRAAPIGGVERAFILNTPDVDVLNFLGGFAVDLNGRSSISATYGVPVTDDKQFDGELRVLFNRFL